MSSSSVTVPSGSKTTPLNFIYACSICCCSFADIYEGRSSTVQGLSDGINPKQRLVTQLYLASCCHVFCGRHLQDGASPFHPEGERSKATCPVCVREVSDAAPRDLYSIRGFEKDEHDPTIPSIWFDVPPAKLNEKGEEMEALRFQYLALVRYCQHTYATRKPLQDALSESDKKLTKAEHLISKERATSAKLQQELEYLRSEEKTKADSGLSPEYLRSLEQELEQYRKLRVNPRDLATFKKNKAAITQYLKLVPTLVEQNQKMRDRLSSLGFAMALEPVPNLQSLDIHTLDDEPCMANDHSPISATISRRTTINDDNHQGSAYMSGALNIPTSNTSSRPAKRQRVASLEQSQEKSSLDRELMPPPRKTISRKLSVRKILPTLRRKFNVGTSRQTTQSSNNEPMYRDNFAAGMRMMTPHSSDLIMDQDHVQRTPVQPANMTSHHAPAQISHPFSKRNTDITINDFAFRSPSTNQVPSDHRSQGGLPQEPSYLRLMDGLSYDDGIELGLQDPRQKEVLDIQQSEHFPPYDHLQNSQSMRDQPTWRSGMPQCRRKPLHESSSPNELLQRQAYDNTHHDPSRSLHGAGTFMPATPVRQETIHRNPPIDSVVSSSAKSIYRTPPGYDNRRVAEVRGSSTRFGDYQSQDPRRDDDTPRWEAPRGLNGLSFIDTPLDSRNRPIRYWDSYESSSQHRLRSSTMLDNPIVERESHESPFFSSNQYQHVARFSGGESQRHSLGLGRPYASFRTPSVSRLSAIPHTTPLTLTARAKPQWLKLQRAGVRSSRQGFAQHSSTPSSMINGCFYANTGFRSARP